MPTNFYPDGFPMDPIEAVKVCDFLTPKEKEEWNNWLVNATPEQKTELVDTLHSIFIEQKSSIAPAAPVQPAPGPFNPQQPAAPYPPIQPQDPFSAPIQQPQPPFNQFNQGQAPQPVPAPFNNPVVQQPFVPQSEQAPASVSAPAANAFAPFTPTPSPAAEQSFNPPFQSQPAQIVEDDPYKQSEAEFLKELESQKARENSNHSKPESPDFQFQTKEDKMITQDDFFLGESNKTSFDHNPLLDDIDSQMDADKKKPSLRDSQLDEPKPAANNSQSDFSRSKQPQKTREQNNSGQNQSKNQQPKPAYQSEDDYVKKAESMMLSAGEVSNLYKHFLDTQNKSVTLEKEFQDKQAKLFNKIMEMVSEASIISDKVLKLNFQMVDNAKSIQELKNATAVKGSVSLQYQINTLKDEMRRVERNLEYGVEKIEREFNVFRDDISQRVDEINTQLAAAMADTYKADGVLEALAKLQVKFDSKIESLEKRLQQTGQSGHSKPNNNQAGSGNSRPSQEGGKPKQPQNQPKNQDSAASDKNPQSSSNLNSFDGQEAKTSTSNIATLAGNSKPKDNTDFGSIFSSTFPNLSDFSDDYDFVPGEGAKKVTVKTGEPQDMQ